MARNIKDYYDLEEVLFDGSKSEILKIKCPECGGSIEFDYCPETYDHSIRCLKCGILIRSHGAEHHPKAFFYFGKKMVIHNNEVLIAK